MQYVPITTNVVSLNPTHGEVYSIEHYVIKFVSDLLTAGCWFSPGTLFSSCNKTDHHDITEILLKVALHHSPNNYICILWESRQFMNFQHMNHQRISK